MRHIKSTAIRRTMLQAALLVPMGARFAPALAQSWPAKPIRLVLPSGAGGGSDIFGRPMAEFLSKELKQQVVVDNKPGANGIIAHEAVVRQPADGYTVLISYSAAMIANKLLQPKMSHDPLKDFIPVAQIGGGGGNMLIVNPELPIRNMQELYDYARSKNGTATYGSWGISSGGHLVMEMIKTRTGMQITHVPYKTVAQIAPDIVSGVLPVSWIDSASPLPFIKSGRVRAIAVASPSRLPQTPDVRTLKEQGVDYDIAPVYGLYAPAGTPKSIVDTLNAAVNKWLSLPETVEYFELRQNAPKPQILTADEFARKQELDVLLWRKLIEDSKVKLDT